MYLKYHVVIYVECKKKKKKKEAIYINGYKEALGSGIRNVVYCFKSTIPHYFGAEKMKSPLQEKIHFSSSV